MKNIVLAAMILISGIVTSCAQGNEVEKKTKKMVARLTEVCGLSSDQTAKVTPLVKTYEETKEANKQKYSNDPDQLKAANKTNHENFENGLKTVLDSTQIAKFKEYRKEQREKKEKNKSGNEE